MITEFNGWRRDKPGLGVWEHRGKVAIAGIGHSPVDRRWDGEDLNQTLGAYAMLACERAMADAGVTKDEVDGILCCPESMAGAAGGAAGFWSPRPYFEKPYDTEVGLSIVNNQWLIENMGLKNIEFAPDNVPDIGQQVGMVSQAIGEKKCNTALIIYTGANFEGRYRRGGDNAKDTAEGGRAFSVPWGNHGGNDFINAFALSQYCIKYGGHPNQVGPFVLNQHRNGRLSPWGFYVNNESYVINEEDYVNSRYILRPLRLWDCDRPVNTVTAYLFTTDERAKDMRQKPVYVLSHSQHNFPVRSTQVVLEEMEAATDFAAGLMYEGSGLTPKDLDIFNPYDGYSYMTQFWLEAFQWHGVKRGDAFDFYAGDIRVEGPHPFCSGGGNLGNGRTRSAMYTDSIEQLRGTTGVIEGFDDNLKDQRKVTVKAETAMAAFCPPLGGGWLALSNSPD